MRAAALFVQALSAANSSAIVTRIQIELFGSLGATGKGHGTDKAVILGLEGDAPEKIDTDSIPAGLE